MADFEQLREQIFRRRTAINQLNAAEHAGTVNPRGVLPVRQQLAAELEALVAEAAVRRIDA